MSNKPTAKFNKQTLIGLFNKSYKYLWIGLVLFFVIIFVNIALTINNDLSLAPSQSSISSDLNTTPQTSINTIIVNKLEALKNNSVSVQALFNQSRQNPFQ